VGTEAPFWYFELKPKFACVGFENHVELRAAAWVVALIHSELEAERLPLDQIGDLDSRSIELAKPESTDPL